MDKLFLQHPRAQGETYWQHLRFAVGMSLRLIAAGGACLAHALVPAVFERTASTAVKDLHARMTSAGR